VRKRNFNLKRRLHSSHRKSLPLVLRQTVLC